MSAGNTETQIFDSLKLCFVDFVYCHNKCLFGYLWSFVQKFASSQEIWSLLWKYGVRPTLLLCRKYLWVCIKIASPFWGSLANQPLPLLTIGRRRESCHNFQCPIVKKGRDWFARLFLRRTGINKFSLVALIISRTRWLPYINPAKLLFSLR